MRNIILFCVRLNISIFPLFLLFALQGYAQTDISGTINSYAKVVSVDGPDQVTLNDASAFSIGDTVLIIQMKGVEINVPNNSSFGLKQNSLGAGFYEFLIVSDITGNQITFSADMAHEADYDPVGHVQLVRVPGYDNARVTADITCTPWDSVAGFGGVVAMIVGNTLELNADIDVSACGFQGGSSVVRPSGTCSGNTDYFFNDASTEGGYKGEGSATYSTGPIHLGTGYIKGRGAYFNGGGGGNSKYSGGGGGGNGGRGGDGGIEEISCGFNLIGGIKGHNIPDNMDFKGQKRIFLGGGGGAGTQLTAGEGTSGGNGGGIVVIVADTVIGADNYIRSNGQSVTGVASGNGGAGGGGAGGTILLEVNSYRGSNLNLEARGGNGGSVSGNPSCTGPGGGGGGGIIWHYGAALPAEVSTDVTGGAIVTGTCTSMIPEAGSPGTATNDLIVPLTGFLFNSIYSSRNGLLSDTICEDEVPPLMVGTQPKGGTTPYTYVWESSEDKTVWDVIAGATLQNYTPVNPLTDTTYYRRTVLDISVPQIVDVSKTLAIIVQPKIQNYDITTDDTICYNQVPPLITSDALGPPIGGDGPGSYFYYWEDSISGGLWNIVAGATEETYLPPALTQTTYFRRTTQSGIGCPETSNVSTVTVLPLVTNNDITADEVICEGFAFAPLDGTNVPVLSGGNIGDGDYRFQWIESTDGTTWNNAYGPNTNEDYAPDTTSAAFPSTDTVYFSRVVISGPLDVCIDTSEVVKLVQWPEITNNEAPNDLVYCEGDDPDQVAGTSPGGGDGTNYLFQWQQLNGSWGTATGTSDQKDYDPDILTDTLFYRRIVTSDVCKDTSIVDTIPVNPAVLNYNIQTLSAAADTTICFGQVPNKLIPQPPAITGGDGVYTYVWEKSENGGASWTTTGGDTPDFAPPALDLTTTYRRKVISGACTEVSNEITVNVLPAITNNTLTANGYVCYNLPITITGSDPGGGDGSYLYSWEESPDDVTWDPANGTSDQRDYTSPSLTSDIYYRRVVTSGPAGCCQDISASVYVKNEPLPSAVLDPLDISVCSGSDVDLTFTVTGNNGPWDLTFNDGFNDQAISIPNTAAYAETLNPVSTVEYTNYTYTITNLVDAKGCVGDPATLTGLAKVRVDGVPTVDAGPDGEACGLSYTMQAVMDFGTGSWSSLTTVVDAANNSDPNKTVTVDSYGIHTFTWTVANGTCTGYTDDVSITFYEPPTAADAGKDTTLAPLTTTYTLQGNTPLAGTGIWTKIPADAPAIISDPTDPNSEVTNLSDETENKFVWTISNGTCPVESDEVIISVILFKIPNGFSPNGDDINDYFVISAVQEYPNELIIINRQGKEVFRAVDYQNDWDGKYSSGEDVPDDTYYYILYYTKEDDTRHKANGWLIIKR